MSTSIEHPDLGNPALVALIREEIAAAGGRITFARFMNLALYHPRHGYYLAAERRPGRGGDFLTAPELHPFFGFALARQIADCWERLDRPESFVVREYGAGVGGLAYDVIAGLTEERPEIARALRYQLLEPNPHRRGQAMMAMAEVGLADRVSADDPDFALAQDPITGVILANEVVDALPVHRLIVRNESMREAYVTWNDEPPGFAEVEGEPSEPALGESLWDDLTARGVQLQEGDRLDVSPAAGSWFAGVTNRLERGYTIIIDYGYAAPELYRGHRLAGTVRAYSQHSVTDDPFKRIGQQDLTAHVDFTALERAGQEAGLVSAGLTTQGAFLASLGLGDFLVRMQQDPATDPETYFRAQAAVYRLIDPGGMGRFSVLMMARDAPVEPPLRGFRETPPSF
ncbi:MAG TPA: SAM-dependent methyltransferase [Thermomicrobiales bacterium]|nr:SAM-dependent methyltransferase [Thermomicrobiales bacterium]